MLRKVIAPAGVLCIVCTARPSNAEPLIFRWTAPDGSVFTARVSTDPLPRPATPYDAPPRQPPPRAAPPLAVPPPRWPNAPGPQSPATQPTGGYEQEVLTLTNIRRAQGATCGGQYFPPATPLSTNAALQSAAELHSRDMGERNYFDHTSLDGRSPGDRIRATGFSARTWGENIYGGATSPAQAVDGWMASPGHCRNIMDPHFRYLGVGYANVQGSRLSSYWTQDFGG
jgi:uncharacterized protein YkwD